MQKIQMEMLELKNLITEIKNIFSWFTRGLNKTKESVNSR